MIWSIGKSEDFRGFGEIFHRKGHFGHQVTGDGSSHSKTEQFLGVGVRSLQKPTKTAVALISRVLLWQFNSRNRPKHIETCQAMLRLLGAQRKLQPLEFGVWQQVILRTSRQRCRAVQLKRPAVGTVGGATAAPIATSLLKKTVIKTQFRNV